MKEINENQKQQATPEPDPQQPLRLTHPDPSHPRNWALWDPACDVDAEYADWFK